ncbi:MAG: transcription initiation factor IIB family protein [Thermoprotei archaeon]|nr:MAG: transcription initiation factor IIB family protein [Thermoprotei archaeon]
MLHEHDLCPECGGKIVFDEGVYAYVCTKCGCVIEDRPVSYELEIRLFDNRIPRTSGTSTHKVHDHGIGSTELDVSTAGRGVKWHEIARVQKRARVSKKERVIEKALRFMNHYAKVLGIPNYVAETAGKILREAVEGKNYKNKTLKNLAIASIYVALRAHGRPKPAKLFSREAGISLKELWHSIKKIYDSVGRIGVKKEEPSVYVVYIVNKLKLSHNVEKLANILLTKIHELELDIGKPAVGLATAAVYLASILLNEKRTQIQVAETVNVSDVTIRNRYGELVEALDITVYV